MTTMKITQPSPRPMGIGGANDPRWLMASGVVAVLLSLAGLAMLPVLTIAAVLTLGVVLLGAAVYQLAKAWNAAGLKARGMRLGYALAYAFGGAAMVLNPPGAATGMTLVIAAALGLVGIQRLLLTGRTELQEAASGRRATGLFAIVAGTAILLTWPVSSVWAIGVAVSAILGAMGWRNLAVGTALRRGRSEGRSGPSGADDTLAA